MPLIELQDIHLTFHVHRAARISLKEYLLAGRFKRSRSNDFEVPALQGLNLRVEEEDRIGIIGSNGAGKSTLLKLVAGIYPPSGGRRTVRGRISSLFDIALGFELDASGWENIRYRGYLQGETPRTIRDKMLPIAEFSELGRFLDMPVRYYSAGMMVRLAFSIATAIEPKILLIDEVFAAGDMEFQDKARQHMRKLIHHAQAVLMVSHDLPTLALLCDQVLWLDHGRVRMLGPASTVIEAYKASGRTAASQAA
jgi:ABC-type polysaccharide/polyol phosphate transport system ATPase subunit